MTIATYCDSINYSVYVFFRINSHLNDFIT